MELFDEKNWKCFLNCVSDLLVSDEVRSMQAIPHHPGVNCYEHSVFVAYVAFRLARRWGVDYVAAARGGLLHDLYLYNWQDPRSHPGVRHATQHPVLALKNARARFTVSDREADIILTHMFPVTPTRFYGCLESFVVSTMDKLCAAAELLRLVPLLTPAEEAPAYALPAQAPALRARAAG